MRRPYADAGTQMAFANQEALLQRHAQAWTTMMNRLHNTTKQALQEQNVVSFEIVTNQTQIIISVTSQ